MTAHTPSVTCDDVATRAGRRSRRRMTGTSLITLGLQLLLTLCWHQPARAQANDALWKTYMEAARKAQGDKNHEEAERLYKLAESKAAAFGASDERFIETLTESLKLYLAMNKKAEAELRYKLLLASLDKGAGTRKTAEQILLLGHDYNAQKMHAEAEALYKHALALYRRVMQPGDKQLSDYLYYLGSTYYSQDKFAEAEETFKELLKVLEGDPTLGKQMITAYALGMLGFITNKPDRYPEAESYTRRALEVTRKLHGENHPNTASMHHALFLTLIPQGKYDEGEVVIKRAIEINEHVYGKTSAQVETVVDSLATQYIRQARFDEAVTMLTRSLDILDGLPNRQPNRVVNVADRLLGVRLRQHKYTEGEAVCKRARTISEKMSPKSAEANSFVTDCFVSLYFSAGNYAAEAETVKKIVESQEWLGPDGEAALVGRLIELGNSYLRQQKYDDAIAVYRRAEQIVGKNPTKPNLRLHYALARYYYLTGNYAESESHFVKVFAVTDRDKNALDALNVAWFKKGYALLLYAQGKTAEAEELFKKSVETLKTDKVDGERDAGTSYHELATLLAARGRPAEAESLFRQAVELRERALGAEHPELASSLESYAALLRAGGRGAEAAPLEARALAIRSKQHAP